MRLLIKLVLAGILIAVLVPFISPDTSIGKVVRAALDDASGFCGRQPNACMESASIAAEAGDLIAATIAQLQSGGGETTLSDADRALGFDQTIPPPAPGRAAAAGGNAPRS